MTVRISRVGAGPPLLATHRRAGPGMKRKRRGDGSANGFEGYENVKNDRAGAETAF